MTRWRRSGDLEAEGGLAMLDNQPRSLVTPTPGGIHLRRNSMPSIQSYVVDACFKRCPGRTFAGVQWSPGNKLISGRPHPRGRVLEPVSSGQVLPSVQGQLVQLWGWERKLRNIACWDIQGLSL